MFAHFIPYWIRDKIVFMVGSSTEGIFFFVKRLPKVGGYDPSLDCCKKPSILMTLVLEDRYQPPLSIKLKSTSRLSFDVTMTF